MGHRKDARFSPCDSSSKQSEIHIAERASGTGTPPWDVFLLEHSMAHQPAMRPWLPTVLIMYISQQVPLLHELRKPARMSEHAKLSIKEKSTLKNI